MPRHEFEMDIVFLSNYFTHHQKPLSDALAKIAGYTFVSTEPISQERLSLGWGIDEPEYVCHYDRDPQRVMQLIAKADAVIVGSAPDNLVRIAINQKKLVLRYSERPLKKGNEWHKYAPRWLKWHLQNPYGNDIFLLCASAYTAGDYAKFGLFHDRAFRWGYFPEARRYDDVLGLLDKKEPASVLWAGRFLDWKHPDDAVQVASRLKAAGVAFQMNLIGRGDMEEPLRRLVKEKGLEDCVHLLDSMKPEAVRQYMEHSQIYLFTSDRNEGWGAVLNEAMNSGCAVVASDAIGAVPFLLRHEETGCIYPSGNVDVMTELVLKLLQDQKRTRELGYAAYKSISEEWNAETAALRLVELIRLLLAGEKKPNLYSAGPCSPAPIIREDWFRK